MPLPAASLRRNLATWAVPPRELPAAAAVLLDALPAEAFDPAFRGQDLVTTYFDTAAFDLFKARRKSDRYLTLRLRCYRPPGDGPEAYALSAKTESQKWRQEVDDDAARGLLADPAGVAGLLPADLLARLMELTDDRPLVPAAAVCCRRYAVEDGLDRYTLDVDVGTDTGKALPFAVLEFKSTQADATPPGRVAALGLRPAKVSKFLWAAGV